jgi:hypothetical protein
MRSHAWHFPGLTERRQFFCSPLLPASSLLAALELDVGGTRYDANRRSDFGGAGRWLVVMTRTN